jgi:hypothetical protein
MNHKPTLTVRQELEFGENSGEKTQTDDVQYIDIASFFNLPSHERRVFANWAFMNW